MRRLLKSFVRTSTVALLAMFCLSCLAARQPGIYKTQFPVLHAKIQTSDCAYLPPGATAPVAAKCVKLLERDFTAYVVELQGACRALGGTKKECGIVKKDAPDESAHN